MSIQNIKAVAQTETDQEVSLVVQSISELEAIGVRAMHSLGDKLQIRSHATAKAFKEQADETLKALMRGEFPEILVDDFQCRLCAIGLMRVLESLIERGLAK